MAYNQFDASVSAVSLTGATTTSMLGVLAAANIALKWLEGCATFNGATSTNAPALVDFARCTFATNAPGTNSSVTTVQKRDPGRAETIQASAGNTWTAEPTVVTAQFSRYIAAYDGSYHYINPQTNPLILVGGKGNDIRANAPVAVSCTSSMVCEE